MTNPSPLTSFIHVYTIVLVHSLRTISAVWPITLLSVLLFLYNSAKYATPVKYIYIF